MTNQSNHAQVASKPFALICSYRVPTTELSPDFVPSVCVVVGCYDSQEQAKHARQAINHAALISAWCHYSFDGDCTVTAHKEANHV